MYREYDDYQYGKQTGKKYHTAYKKAKERQIQKVFLAEGMRIFEEIPKEYLQNVYVSESFLQKKRIQKIRRYRV